MTKFGYGLTTPPRSLLLVPMKMKTPLGPSASQFFDRPMAHSDFEVFADFKANVWIGRFSLNFPTLLKNVNDVSENPDIAISYIFAC